MVALLLLALTPGQFVDDPAFPRERQKAAVAATVRISHPATKGEGSGVVVLYEAGIAYILTAAHCVPPSIPNGDAVDVFFFSPDSLPKPKERVEGATVRERMANEDLAIVSVPMASAPATLPLPPSFKLEAEPRGPFAVMTVGCETNGAPGVVIDRVLGRRIVKKPDNTRGMYWETEKRSQIGRSGGPMVSKDGFVIGICSGTQGNKGYYTHARDMLYALEQKSHNFLFLPAGGAGKPGVPKFP